MNAVRSSACLIVVLVAVAGVLAPPGVFAGTRRDDVADSEYLSLALSYPTVGMLRIIGGHGSATLIRPNYILTAAHVAEDIVVSGFSDGRFILGGNTYYVAEVFLHPNWDGDATHGSDIAVVRLNQLELNINPATLCTGSGEIGTVGTYVGYGDYGTGLTGAVGNDGKKRAGKNVIDELGSYYGYPDHILLADFDSPYLDLTNRMGSPDPIAMEYCVAPGDSGGGMFITVGGTEYLAGVNSFARFYGDTDFDYNDVPAVTRVSSFASWVTSTIAGSGDTMVWQAAVSGSFNDNTKWQRNRDLSPLTREVVPGAVDSAMFNKAGT